MDIPQRMPERSTFMRPLRALTLGMAFWGSPAFAQTPAIASISICSATGAGGQGSCPSGALDTHQIVLAPDGSGHAINTYGLGRTSDEHSSVFSPGTLGSNSDYLFFVASGTGLNPDIGMTVLSGGAGPGTNGQWTFDFARADNYGSYAAGYGTVFLAPTTQNRCPTVSDGNPAHQDQTFDLNYAAPGFRGQGSHQPRRQPAHDL